MLTPLQDLLSFLTELGLPYPLTVSLSNSGWSETTTYKMQARLQFSSKQLPKSVQALLTNGPLGRLQLALKTGVGNSIVSGKGALLGSSSQWSYYFTFSGNAQVPVFEGVTAGGLIAFGVTVAFPAGTTPAKRAAQLLIRRDRDGGRRPRARPRASSGVDLLRLHARRRVLDR